MRAYTLRLVFCQFARCILKMYSLAFIEYGRPFMLLAPTRIGGRVFNAQILLDLLKFIYSSVCLEPNVATFNLLKCGWR